LGFLELLTLIFIVLKLFDVIGWAWWQVLIPLYPAIILYLVFISTFIMAAFATKREVKKTMRRNRRF
jgi:MFS superfamily sulfate permease-like transporter